MNNIKKLVIRGLKVFKNFEIEFNNDTNIIIGDNESGKSTIIEAIEIVLNKKYVNYDKYIIEELINKENKKIFEEKKEYNLLPKIEIYAILNLDNSCQNNFDFYGDHGICKNTEEYGIKFLCQFDEKWLKIINYCFILLDKIVEIDIYSRNLMVVDYLSKTKCRGFKSCFPCHFC